MSVVVEVIYLPIAAVGNMKAFVLSNMSLSPTFLGGCPTLGGGNDEEEEEEEGGCGY